MSGLVWRRSSFCSASTCVEVAIDEHGLVAGGRRGIVALRDSKHPVLPALAFSRAEWCDFINAAKAGEFDLND